VVVALLRRAVVIGLIIGLRITADQQRPEQTGGPPL
jgi:hypothetical protein